MTDLRKAAKMALARLEHTIAYSNEEMAKIDEAKHALRQALAQEKQIEVWGKPLVELREALKEAEELAQQGKECLYPECETGIGCNGPCGEKPVDTVNTSQKRVDETAKRGHEPVAWMKRWDGGDITLFKTKPTSYDDYELQPLYTAPPKREWQGLTDEELPEGATYEFDRGVRWAEAKLKEKNT